MIAFDNQIVKDILECVEKANELLNQFLIKSICQKLIPFHSSVKKNKSKSFCDSVQQTEVSSCGKTKSAEVNRYIIGTLTSFSVQSGKVINY